jgi:catechol 2,3-dioxygenase-like lactoylglutathione lyase family enzyme
MLKRDEAFSGFSVDDIAAAKRFCGDVLGFDVRDGAMGDLEIAIGGGKHVFVYPKEDHQPATYTVFNVPTDDIDGAVAELRGKGVTFEQYEDVTDADGIARGQEIGMGPDIAWFRDPAGNILGVLQT